MAVSMTAAHAAVAKRVWIGITIGVNEKYGRIGVVKQENYSGWILLQPRDRSRFIARQLMFEVALIALIPT
jgi:hypothetical protein